MSLSLQDTMRRVIRRDIQDMHAYAVQPSAGLVKVDTMENPHPLPPALQQALGERLGRVAIHRYPAERGDDLKPCRYRRWVGAASKVLVIPAVYRRPRCRPARGHRKIGA